jgi:transcriptional regulator with XRE-family HTH domain
MKSSTPTDLRQEMALRIRARREYLGYSQQDIAVMIGRTRSGFTQIESGRNGIDAVDIADIARALGAPVSYFYGETPESMSEDETNLLSLFRALPTDRQKLAVDIVRTLLKSERES